MKNTYKCHFDVQDWITWNIEPEKLISLTKDIITKSEITYNELCNLNGKELNYENVINRLQDDHTLMNIFYSMGSFFQYVSPNKELREASIVCDKMLNNYFIKINSRKDVFEKINEFFKKIDESDKFKKNFYEDHRFIKRLVRDYKRNGIHLDDEQLKNVTKLSKRISDLENDFQNNLNNENTILLFEKNELEGLEDSFINSLKTCIVKKNLKYKKDKSLKDEEINAIKKEYNNDPEQVLKYEVSLKYPIYRPCLKYVKIESTRKLLAYEYNRRCIEKNTEILLELIDLRNKRAHLLGYKSHVDYVTETEVIKNADNVNNLMNELLEKTDNLIKNDIEILQNTSGKEINDWDIQYYIEQIKKQKYDVNTKEIKNYFPKNHVLKEILGIYEHILDLSFVKNDDKLVWHPSVDMYDVYDGESDDYIGTFYLDLHPRENKYGHAACFTLQPSCSLSDKQKIYPVSAIVANFTEETEEMPSLLNLDEVITFFHEFGHLMHQLLGRTKICVFSGSSTETDFVEAPSQMLENWCWNKEILKKLSKHYETKKSLDDNTIDKLIKIKNIFNGISLRRSIYLTKFDYLIHSDQKLIKTLEESKNIKIKTKVIYYILKQIKETITKIPLINNTFFPASFGHLAGGYDGKYYSYLHSEIYSADMFVERFCGNLLDKNVGKLYRTIVLEKGGTIDGDIIVKNFIGRKVKIDNFLNLRNINELSNNDTILDKPLYEDYIYTSEREMTEDQINDLIDTN